MDTSVQELLDLEWRLFDAAPQAGQRPACPEDREQFQLSRSAQLAVWFPELRESGPGQAPCKAGGNTTPNGELVPAFQLPGNRSKNQSS